MNSKLAELDEIVAEEHADFTLEKWIRVAYGGIPWSKARELCRVGRVWVNEVVVQDSATRVKPGDRIEVKFGGPRRRAGVLPDEAIAYVDRDVVVVRKPAGVLTVPYEVGDRDTLVDQTRAALRRRQSASSGDRYDPALGVVHRLDKDTTGVLVFTRTHEAKKHLAQQFRSHTVERRYLAIVHGAARDTTHRTWVVQDRGDGLRGSFGHYRRPRGPRPDDARLCVTHVRVLERLRGATLIECKLDTGRQHQIRIHVSEAGSPIVGERVYIRDYQGLLIEAARPLLHATSLGFEHPRTFETLQFDEPPPLDFEVMLNTLRSRH